MVSAEQVIGFSITEGGEVTADKELHAKRIPSSGGQTGGFTLGHYPCSVLIGGCKLQTSGAQNLNIS